jgi:hypothetical protein
MAMTTAQDSPRRKKQKIRRAKQLANWRAGKADAGTDAKSATGTAATARAK